MNPKSIRRLAARGAPAALREAAPVATRPAVINLRAAKDRLSRLVEQAAAGDEVIITRDGVPTARLVPVRAARRPFRVAWDLLRATRVRAGGASADALVRADRDRRP